MSVNPYDLASYLERCLPTTPGDDDIPDEYHLRPAEVRAICAALRVDPISRVRLSENDLTDAIAVVTQRMPSLSHSGDDAGGWSDRDFAREIIAELERQLIEDGGA